MQQQQQQEEPKSADANQPDLVARSHELSKRRFFEKLERREESMKSRTLVCGPKGGTGPIKGSATTQESPPVVRPGQVGKSIGERRSELMKNSMQNTQDARPLQSEPTGLASTTPRRPQAVSLSIAAAFSRRQAQQSSPLLARSEGGGGGGGSTTSGSGGGSCSSSTSGIGGAGSSSSSSSHQNSSAAESPLESPTSAATRARFSDDQKSISPSPDYKEPVASAAVHYDTVRASRNNKPQPGAHLRAHPAGLAEREHQRRQRESCAGQRAPPPPPLPPPQPIDEESAFVQVEVADLAARPLLLVENHGYASLRGRRSREAPELPPRPDRIGGALLNTPPAGLPRSDLLNLRPDNEQDADDSHYANLLPARPQCSRWGMHATTHKTRSGECATVTGRARGVDHDGDDDDGRESLVNGPTTGASVPPTENKRPTGQLSRLEGQFHSLACQVSGPLADRSSHHNRERKNSSAFEAAHQQQQSKQHHQLQVHVHPQASRNPNLNNLNLKPTTRSNGQQFSERDECASNSSAGQNLSTSSSSGANSGGFSRLPPVRCLINHNGFCANNNLDLTSSAAAGSTRKPLEPDCPVAGPGTTDQQQQHSKKSPARLLKSFGSFVSKAFASAGGSASITGGGGEAASCGGSSSGHFSQHSESAADSLPGRAARRLDGDRGEPAQERERPEGTTRGGHSSGSRDGPADANRKGLAAVAEADLVILPAKNSREGRRASPGKARARNHHLPVVVGPALRLPSERLNSEIGPLGGDCHERSKPATRVGISRNEKSHRRGHRHHHHSASNHRPLSRSISTATSTSSANSSSYSFSGSCSSSRSSSAASHSDSDSDSSSGSHSGPGATSLIDRSHATRRRGRDTRRRLGEVKSKQHYARLLTSGKDEGEAPEGDSKQQQQHDEEPNSSMAYASLPLRPLQMGSEPAQRLRKRSGAVAASEDELANEASKHRHRHHHNHRHHHHRTHRAGGQRREQEGDAPDSTGGLLAGAKCQSLSLYQSLLRNYVKRRHRHHSHHHHRHHHHHHHRRGHSSHHDRHAHCVSLPPMPASGAKNCSPSSLTSGQASLTSGSLAARSSLDRRGSLAAGSSCRHHAGACDRAPSVWGQLVKINKSDGSQVVELQRAPNRSWGFFVARGSINNTKGIFITRMHECCPVGATRAGTATGKPIASPHHNQPLAGLLSIGDRILAIDNSPIEPDDILRVNQMISRKSKILLRVKPFKG